MSESAGQKYARLLRRRKALYVGFVPVALLLMLLLQSGVTGLPPFLAFPLLLIYIVACVMYMHSIDVCPWCKRSFHNALKPGAGPRGFATLWRKRCANCGMPTSGTPPADLAAGRIE